jgi:hypothetical protein
LAALLAYCRQMIDVAASLSTFPDHRAIAKYIIRALREDDRVLGLYLSGSFAYGGTRHDAANKANIAVQERNRAYVQSKL